MKEKLISVKLADVKSNSPYILKDFMISNIQKDPIGEIISFNEPFVFDGIVLCLCKEGSGQVRLNFKEYKLEKNSVLIILPQQIFECMSHSNDFAVEILAFSLDFITSLPLPKDGGIPQEVVTQPILAVSEKQLENLMRYHLFITEVFSNNKPLYLKEIIQGLLFALIMEITSMYTGIEQSEIKKSRGEQITERFMTILLKNENKSRFVSYYANEMCMTPKYLSSVVKKVTGRTINSWIEEVLILNAKMFLKSSDYTVLEISEELNFPNPSYFGRFFKKVTGMTPLQYRGS